MDAESYERLYRDGSRDAWDGNETLRCDHDAIRTTIKRLTVLGSNVLDIGCGAGALLAPLSSEYKCYGVEISREAAETARLRGIDTLDESFQSLECIDKRFDAVVAADVIEHSLSPSKFIADAVRLLKPGGHLIITTGTADCTLFRASPKTFWYMQFPEHLCLASERWFRSIATSELKLESVEKFRYHKLSYIEWIWRLLKTVIYSTLPQVYRLSVRVIGLARLRSSRHFESPGLGVDKDHMLVVFRKEPVANQ